MSCASLRQSMERPIHGVDRGEAISLPSFARRFRTFPMGDGSIQGGAARGTIVGHCRQLGPLFPWIVSFVPLVSRLVSAHLFRLDGILLSIVFPRTPHRLSHRLRSSKRSFDTYLKVGPFVVQHLFHLDTCRYAWPHVGHFGKPSCWQSFQPSLAISRCGCFRSCHALVGCRRHVRWCRKLHETPPVLWVPWPTHPPHGKEKKRKPDPTRSWKGPQQDQNTTSVGPTTSTWSMVGQGNGIAREHRGDVKRNRGKKNKEDAKVSEGCLMQPRGMGARS